jgi:uroporphyrinogen III methyltransferase / synthase
VSLNAFGSERRGCVFLVGAGPGDPRLLTVRAVELLREADVLAYDELVSEEILAVAPPHVERLAVGRRHGAGPTSYRLHPEVMVRAREGKRVVRLKAGDPLIFGRGGEEAEELAEAGIPFEIVPGVTSALGAAAYAGIPLTHRDHASHVTFTTGHDVDGSHGARTAANLPMGGTVVFYMAGRKLAANLAALVAEGWPSNTPAAYVASATSPSQIVIEGTIGDLASKAERVPRDVPAVVIVGSVVGVRAHAQWFGQDRNHEEGSPR